MALKSLILDTTCETVKMSLKNRLSIVL